MRNQLAHDAWSLSLITASSFAALVVTGGLVVAGVRDEVSQRVTVSVRRDASTSVWHDAEIVPVPLTGAGRLYGRVLTRDGVAHVGFIRWDRNEGSWTDLLDANKDAGGQSGIRFGHVQRIDVRGRNRADLYLRSGEVARMSARATDLGSGLRALIVEYATGGSVELGWSDLVRVEFREAPTEVSPAESRIHGTLTTRDGRSFTGYVAWDVDEIFANDVLDGDDEEGRRQKVPFGQIASISRNSSASARIVLNTGGQMILDGTNDVNSSISGISVSDPFLGEVKLGWDAFQEVRFHAPEAAAEAVHFDGGRRIRGTVVTRSGQELVGDVRWDDDEAYSWEMLNGEAGDVQFQIEFGRIARIAKEGRGVMVELLDGRTLKLTGSNDVNSENRGIVIETERGSFGVDWREFVELRLER